jgi:hypothetical protein
VAAAGGVSILGDRQAKACWDRYTWKNLTTMTSLLHQQMLPVLLYSIRALEFEIYAGRRTTKSQIDKATATNTDFFKNTWS